MSQMQPRSFAGSELWWLLVPCSAFEDGRFPPLEENELPELECGISLLVQYEKAKAWDDWVVGTHGILIDFDAGSTSFRATYLPEVAHEQGEIEQCIQAACCSPPQPGMVPQKPAKHSVPKSAIGRAQVGTNSLH